MKTSQEGIDHIKRREGFREKEYDDGAGNPTYGYGHKLVQGDPKGEINKKQAEEFLRQDLKTAEDAVNRLVKIDINQRQFDALVSAVYNIGQTAFAESKALKYLNQEDYEKSKKEFLEFRNKTVIVNGKKELKIVDGLVQRRKDEAERIYGINRTMHQEKDESINNKNIINEPINYYEYQTSMRPTSYEWNTAVSSRHTDPFCNDYFPGSSGKFTIQTNFFGHKTRFHF